MQINREEKCIESPSGLTIFYVGPNISEGALPAIFYFALSGKESLTLAPFNQPVDALKNANIRIFSWSLPFHEEKYSLKETMPLWAENLAKGNNFFSDFFKRSVENINFLIENKLVSKKHMGISGLSRGGFIACHIAALDKRIKSILGFAPLTGFELMKEFKETPISPLAISLNLASITESLTGRSLRFYIGNKDERVGTEKCFSFIKKLTEKNYNHGHRSPPVELIITPSIGYKGHGTSKEVFESGAKWLYQKIKL